MVGSRALKNRIRSTKNIGQMTRAMEAVSAVKMRRSQHSALAARPYALSALNILREVQKTSGTVGIISPFAEIRLVKSSCLVVITSDKGLAGAFNTAVIKRAEKIIKESPKNTVLVTIGKKGRDYFRRKKVSIVGEFLGAGDFGAISETQKISDFLMSLFLEKKCDEMTLIYTNFISALTQEVLVRKFLPFSVESLTDIVESITPMRGRYANMGAVVGALHTKTNALLFEPSPQEVLSLLLPNLLSVQVFHAVLEANASEHSSRMIAMKNASENAADLAGRLNLAFNKARQASITKELLEITGGKEALEN